MLPRTAPTGDLEGLDTLILAIVGRDAPYTPLRLVGGRKPRQWLQTDGDDTPETDGLTPRVAAAAIAAGVAVVAPLAPDMVTLDLDGCAVPTVLEALDALSVLYGAVLAYRTNSGSPNSEHRSYAAPEAARPRFRAAVRALEAMHRPEGVTRWALDDRTADNPDTRGGKGLRLPLSPSLKQGGGPVVPLDAAGHPLSVLEASRMVCAARRAVGLPAVYGYGHATAPTGPETGEQDTPAPSSTPARSSSPAASASRSRRVRFPVVVGVGGEFTPTERLLLETVAPVGQRSDAALPAVRAVVRRCGTAWSAVRSLVMSAPVFAKFAADGERRARAWWDATAGGYAQWLADHPGRGAVEPLRMPGRLVVAERPAVTPEQTDAVLSWLSSSWSPLSARYGVERAARAHTAALFIGARVMLDGRGLEGRAVAVRDLVQWGAAGTPETASRALADLEAAGVLSLSTDYDISAPLEARRWSVPGALPADSGRPDTCFTGGVSSSSLSALTGPGCLWLPPTLRALLSLCPPAGLTAPTVSHLLRCSLSTGYGYLRRLASAGLLLRGTAGAWCVVAVERLEAVAGAAPEAAAAAERLEAARARVADDRCGWRRLWAASTDAAGRVVWRFRHWLRRSASSAASERSADAATCADSASAASPSSTGPWSAVLRRPVGPLRSSSVWSSAVQDALPGLEAPPGGWSSAWSSSWSPPAAVLRRSGVERAPGGPGAPGAGEWARRASRTAETARE